VGGFPLYVHDINVEGALGGVFRKKEEKAAGEAATETSVAFSAGLATFLYKDATGMAAILCGCDDLA
jgi:hypothetical protein